MLHESPTDCASLAVCGCGCGRPDWRWQKKVENLWWEITNVDRWRAHQHHHHHHHHSYFPWEKNCPPKAWLIDINPDFGPASWKWHFVNEREYADWKMWGISLRKIVLKCVTRQTVSRHSRKYQPYFDRALESISLYYQATRYIAVDWKDKEILWQISTFKFAAFFTLPRLIDQRETSVSGLPHHAWSHFSAWSHYIPFKHTMLSLSLS